MRTRLQIVVSEEEARRPRRSAERAGLTLSEWARRALRWAARAGAASGPERKLQAVDRALACGHPTTDVDDLLSEIERGRDLR